VCVARVGDQGRKYNAGMYSQGVKGLQWQSKQSENRESRVDYY
jgi:hypothetical protein